MELIAELEREKRGVYAGAVGYFGYGTVDGDKLMEGAMDVSCNQLVRALQVANQAKTCIALRTMLVKDGIAYLQAGVSVAKVAF
jgi:anthranilate synthase component 1